MPSLPIYTSQRNITAQQSQPLRNEASKPFEMNKEVVGAIQNVTQAWSDAHDVMQYTEAKGAYEVGVADVQARAAADPNYKDTKKYYKELEDAKKNSLKGISNKQVLEKLSLEMNFGNQMAGIKIDTNFKQKEVTANKFNLGQSVEGLQQKKLQASTPAEASQYDSQMQDLLAVNVATGVVTQAEAEKMKDDANMLSAEFDATVNSDEFVKRGSKYYDIPEDKYQKLKETARLSKERGKKEAIEALDLQQQQSEADLTMSLANKEIDRLSVPDITKKALNGEISKKYADAYISVLTSAKHIDKNKKIEKSGFTKFAKELFKSENSEESRAAIVKMLDGAAEGELNEEQLGVLLKTASKHGGKTKGLIGGAVDGLMKIGETRAKFSGERLVYDFFKGLVDGKDPEVAKQEAITNEQIKTNPNRTKYSIGDVVETPLGTMYVWGYYEDGEPDVRKEKPRQ